MANQNCSAVNFLFVLCVFNLLNVALFEEFLPYPPPPPMIPQAVSYYHASTNGELGVRFTFDPPTNKAMHVIISYDTLADPVKTFFTSQLTETVFDKFTQCSTITMFFLPCSMSKLIPPNGPLSCALGSTQCILDRVHACVTTHLKDDRIKLAKFIICTFGGETITEQCMADNKIDQQAIHTCIQNGDGDKQCDAFNTEIENAKKRKPNKQPLSGDKTQDATTDFVGVVCSFLAQANLRCDVGCGVI